mgnify:CR=1 FL=1
MPVIKLADLNKDALTCVPLHVGFSMDGNGRWAKKRGLPRKAGHSQGAKVFRRTVEDCHDIGIKYCTFYAFSTENWKRPKDEVDAIMKLLVKYLDDIRSMAQKNTRIIFLGDKSAFDDDIQARLVEIEEISKNNDGLYVLVALNYGGKDEMRQNVLQGIIKRVRSILTALRKTILTIIFILRAFLLSILL